MISSETCREEQCLLPADTEAADVWDFESAPRQRRRWVYLAVVVLLAGVGVLGLRGGQRGLAKAANLAMATSLAEGDSVVYPVRLVLFRHGFTCANAGHTAGCADPDAPMLHLSSSEQEELFDTLDKIGASLPAPLPIPPIDRKHGIQGRGKEYTGGDPPRPKGYKGDDCMIHLTPWTDHPEKQWHEMGNVIQMRHFYRDPLLTHCSAFQSMNAGKAFRAWLKSEGIKLDFLGSSCLSRTFQTAHYQVLSDPKAWPDVFSKEMLNDGHPLVSQLPYVNEFNPIWGYQPDDVAWPREKQREQLEEAIGEKAMRHLDYSQLEGFTEKQRNAHDWDAFKEEVLGPKLLRLVLERQGHGAASAAVGGRSTIGAAFEHESWGATATEVAGAEGEVQPIVNMAMASHSGVIQEVCNFESRSASNNAAVEMLLLVEVSNDGSPSVVRQSSTCKIVMNAPTQPEDIDLRDVANCVGPPFDFSKAFVSKQKADKTTCEKAALAPDAYPTVPAAKLG